MPLNIYAPQYLWPSWIEEMISSTLTGPRFLLIPFPNSLIFGERLADISLPAMRLGDYPSNRTAMAGDGDGLAAFDVVKQAG